MTRYRIGIDVGGTFTDFVVYDMHDRSVRLLKVATTPADPSIGILGGLRELAVPPAEVDGIAHGTTTATNSLIERDGARTALIVTEGFRDLLEMRRGDRQELYDVQWVPAPPLVPRRHRLEVKERLRWNGEVAAPLDEEQVKDRIETLRARDIEAVAICFINAYQHPEHELRVREMISAALPGVFVTASHEVSEEFREFERGSTVAANAFIGPKVKTYLGNLAERLAATGFDAGLSIMQSNGGICTSSEASRLPVRLARSGPAGGAMALQRLSELTGVGELVGIDIGGTSADVCVIVNGKPRITTPLTVEWGMPLMLPSVDVVSIGAGGGSLAWLDVGGILHMGPQSAGAQPGPACYGLGGERPTATDAQVVLGRLAPEGVLSGGESLKLDLAQQAVDEHVAQPLGMTVAEAAEGMLTILDNNMLQAVRYVTLEKGYDPRQFTLVGLGGAGPLHVVQLARELGMPRAIVPVNPGVLSAWGMLTVDMVQDRSRTVLRRLDVLETNDLSDVFESMRARIEASFITQNVDANDISYECVVDMQYYGQAFSLAIGVAEGTYGTKTDEPLVAAGRDDVRVSEEGILSIRMDAELVQPLEITDEMLERATETFHTEHEREYGHADRGQQVQIVHARLFGRVAVAKPTVEAEDAGGPDAGLARAGVRTVRFDGLEEQTPIYDRELLKPGHLVEGPALIVESSATTVLPPGSSLEVDGYRNLLIATGA